MSLLSFMAHCFSDLPHLSPYLFKELQKPEQRIPDTKTLTVITDLATVQSVCTLSFGDYTNIQGEAQ